MVFEYIAKYIAEHFDMDIEDISKETTFEQLRAESEDIIDMYFEMSRVFDFMPDEDGLYSIEDVGALVDLIESERN